MAGIEDSTQSFCLGALTMIIHKNHNPFSKIKKYSDKIIMNSIALIKAGGRKNYVPSYCQHSRGKLNNIPNAECSIMQKHEASKKAQTIINRNIMKGSNIIQNLNHRLKLILRTFLSASNPKSYSHRGPKTIKHQNQNPCFQFIIIMPEKQLQKFYRTGQEEIKRQ